MTYLSYRKLWWEGNRKYQVGEFKPRSLNLLAHLKKVSQLCKFPRITENATLIFPT
jgi:hypothetical protein